jgi:hypothetical protein
MSQFTNEVVGPITDAELRATPVPVSGTVTANAGTGPFPVSDNGGSITVDGSVNAAVTGTVAVSNFPATQPISGTVSVDNFPGGSVGTATVSRISVGAGAAVTLAVSNIARKRVIIHNETGTLHIKLGSGASITDYTYRLVANTILELDLYYGDVTARKASGTSDVQVTIL